MRARRADAATAATRTPRAASTLSLVAVLLVVLGPAVCAASPIATGRAAAQGAAPAAEAARTPATEAAGLQGRGGETLAPENAQEVSRQSVEGEPLWRALARLVNFAILAGVLVYFLRAPIAQYLARRSTEIRGGLVKAAETRAAALAELASIEQKMKALPAEIEALRKRGAEEIAAEEARIRQVAEAERARLIEQARREIDLRVRAAERDLMKRAAELTVALASDRIKRTISDEDRARLIDRYLAQLGVNG